MTSGHQQRVMRYRRANDQKTEVLVSVSVHMLVFRDLNDQSSRETRTLPSKAFTALTTEH